MSCRTGPLRVGRSLRDAYTGLDKMIDIGPPAGRNRKPSNARPGHLTLSKKRYTSHEVTAPRAVGLSGRTLAFLRLRDHTQIHQPVHEILHCQRHQQQPHNAHQYPYSSLSQSPCHAV